MTTYQDLLAKIAVKEATVAVIGLGYVGLPLALVFEEAGFPVIGFHPGTTREEIVPRLEANATLHLNAQKEETPLAGRRADDPIASGVIEI